MMEEETQWRAFEQTGDIRYYLQYKQQEAVAAATAQPEKEHVDGSNRNTSAGITGSEIPRSR